MRLSFLFLLLPIFACNACNDKKAPQITAEWQFSPIMLEMPNGASTRALTVTSNADWFISSNQSWCTPSTHRGTNGTFVLDVSVTPNHMDNAREAVLTFTSGDTTQQFTISQSGWQTESFVPEGYTLVWYDEFNAPHQPNGRPALLDPAKWWYETGNHGWGNYEIQNYVPGFLGNDTTAALYDGRLKITTRRSGSQVISARVNTHESWLYGYFEVRLRVPAGRGTWPAVWMLPKDFQHWPLDGEIDIMEHVGYDPNVIHATIHTQRFNHMHGTQRGGTIRIPTAQTAFHVYAVEWTPNYIKGFANGEEYFRFDNDGTNNKETWPFNVPFYLKLNLAWGGSWGGAQGTDDNALPAIFEIDYVRVYQKLP